MEIEFRSDNEDDDDDDDDSDDEMPELISSPSSARREVTATVKKSAKKQAAASAFPVRRVRFGDVEAEDLVDENGMVRDGYDYSQHMKEMGKGKFYSADGQFSPQSELARRVELPADVLPSGEEQERLLDAITLTTDVMDEDLREALVNADAFEEIDDDFMAQAAAADPEDSAGAATDGFDYDAHIAKLMEAASGVPKFRGNLSDDEDDDEFDEDGEEFSDEDGEEEDDEFDAADKAEEQRVLDELFEKTLAEEYDDEQLGELEDDDPETRGELVLEGKLLDEIVEDYVSVQLEMLNDEGKIGNPLRSGNRLKEILEECEREREAYEAGEGDDDTMPEDDDAVDLEAELSALYTRNAYLTARAEEQWDCETIVSTYSNLDNHPTVLREENPSKKKKKARSTVAAMDTEALEAAAGRRSTIVLSRKTGMPLGVFETAKKEQEEEDAKRESAEAAVNKRSKAESKEEKRARKEAVKALKSQRRQEKKQWKTAFKEEEQRQLTLTPGGKVSIFKY